MKTSKFIIISILISLFTLPAQANTGLRELGDSLTAYTGFSRVWSPAVRVKNLRVNGNKVSVYTNTPLSHVPWTPARIKDLKRHVSRWVLGHEHGAVTIYSAQTNIETLVTDCGRYGVYDLSRSPYQGTGRECSDLTERNIALWPSHGLYYNNAREEWIWQRATLWTTVEDLYSQEYVRLIRAMLENAGATIYMPRAGLEHQQPGISGMPQWTEGARYWLMAQHADSTLWDIYEGDEYKDDLKCRALWVNALDVPIDVCLAVHTDGLDSGNDSTTIGTLCIYTSADDDSNTRLRDGRDRAYVNRNFADWVQTQLTEDVRHIVPQWTRRQLMEANYCESRVPVVPSMLIELLSHKNMADMKYGLDPKFRFVVARAVYKGILKYLNGKHAVVQPLPVEQTGIHITGYAADSVEAVLRWEAVIDTLEESATPTYYMVYIQQEDGEWDVHQVEKSCETKVRLKRGIQYNYYVVACNEGGLSMPGPIVSAYMDDRNINQTADDLVLVVDGFDDAYGPEWFADSTYAGIVPGSFACEDRMSCAYIGRQWDYTRSHPWINDDNCGWGASYRDHAGQITMGNTRDWSVRHGRVLQKMHISYVSCTGGLFASQPSSYSLVDWVSGRQRKPLKDADYASLAAYLDKGGRLLMSTDHFSAIDYKWAQRYLHASYYAPHATHSGRVTLLSGESGLLARRRTRVAKLMLEPNEEQLFTCTPEGLKPADQAVKMAEYEDMRCTAGVGFDRQTLVYGFPLEAATDFDAIYKRAVEWLREK